MGFLTNNFIAEFFEKVLTFLYSNVVHNYVVVVILAYLVIKLLLTPVDFKQRESSIKTMKLQPKVDELKKRYPDPVVQSQKMRELYKKENVKMMGGCLPAIITMIVLIAFFGALQQMAYKQTIELVRQAAANPGEALRLPNFLWVRNVWQPDAGNASVMPSLAQWQQILKTVRIDDGLRAQLQAIDYEAVIQTTLEAHSGHNNGWYILPLIQGVTMYFSTGYSMSTVATADNPMSGNVMKLVMAAMTTWFCLTNNTLFTIYWIFMNVAMFIQTYAFNKYFEYKDKKQAS